jgi:VanZ family protein
MPVLAWMIVIFAASTDLGSGQHTSRFLIPFLRWLDPHMSWVTIFQIQFFVRKAAHLTEYAILAILLLRAVRSGLRWNFFTQSALVLGLAALYAMTDEFHQSFSPSRTATMHDVMIDCCGAAIGLALYWAVRPRNPTPVAA